MIFDLKLQFALLLFFIGLKSIAQNTSIDEARLLFPSANAIYLKKINEYQISVENKKLSAICKVSEQLFINKETGNIHQNKSISTSKFIEAKNIKASTLIPVGQKFDRKVVEKFELKDDPSSHVFYDDEKSYDFIYPSVQKGAILDLTYDLNFIEPRFLGRKFWVDILPSLEQELIIRLQKNIHLTYKLYYCDSIDLVFSKEEKKNETILKWKYKSKKATKFYKNAPNIGYFEPHIIFYITDYQIDGITYPLLGGVKDLYNWDVSFQKNVNKNEDSRLKLITNELVEGLKDEVEKVKKIFYWVQDNISYVAFEDGFGGFIPRDAGLVCARKYGDCKDMSSIIHEMLRLAGIESYLSIIGTRDIPYTFADFPTPMNSNHMISLYKDPKGKWYFLDATGKHATIDVITSFIQGKQALASINPDSFLIVEAPIIDTSKNLIEDSVTLSIQDKVVKTEGKLKLYGYERLNYLYSNYSLTKEKETEYFQEEFGKGNNKTKFISLSKLDKSRNDKLELNYSFELNDCFKQYENEVYFNLNIDLGKDLNKVEEDRTAPLKFDHKFKKTVVTTLNIPKNFKIDFIPANVSEQNEIAGFSNKYELVKGKIQLTTTLFVNTLLLRPNDFLKYNKVVDQQLKSRKQTITLIKSL